MLSFCFAKIVGVNSGDLPAFNKHQGIGPFFVSQTGVYARPPCCTEAAFARLLYDVCVHFILLLKRWSRQDANPAIAAFGNQS